MTRINAGISPKDLHRRHLIAEYREITMVPASLRRALRTKSKVDILKSIPAEFTLNKGHVTFFYDKQDYLLNRFLRLCEELEERGYKFDESRGSAFFDLPVEFYNDWSPSIQSTAIVWERIRQRVNEKPHLYGEEYVQSI